MDLITGANLFNWLNTNKDKVDDSYHQMLDQEEVKQAEEWGFSLFQLKENMTYSDFEDAFKGYLESLPDGDLAELDKQEYNIHVKYIQFRYGSKLEPEEGEDIETFEARVETEAELRKESSIRTKPSMGLN